MRKRETLRQPKLTEELQHVLQEAWNNLPVKFLEKLQVCRCLVLFYLPVFSAKANDLEQNYSLLNFLKHFVDIYSIFFHKISTSV